MTALRRLVFMGTPEFAVPSLRAVVGAGFEVAAVVSQPDRPRGRGQQVSFPAVKTAALELGLPVLQPRRKGQADILAELKSLQPDLILVVAFGQLLSQEVLDIPRLGVLNVHASLLPRYRGAAPIQWAILNGDELTGVTIMWLALEMDAGDIFLQEEQPIRPDDTAGSLAARLAVQGAALLVTGLKEIEAGRLVRRPQPSEGVTYAPMITKEMQRLDFSQPAPALQRLIRALDPSPGAYTFYRGQVLKVFRPVVGTVEAQPAPPGTVLQVTAAGAEVACGDGSLWLQELQLAGRRRLSALEFARGQQLLQQRLG
jgi:methionyl-tRNA formyltransferase